MAADEPLLDRLLRDAAIDPRAIERAGWLAIRSAGRLPAPDAPAEAIASWLEADGFARSLLETTQLTLLDIEQRLTTLRRWLLLGGDIAAWPAASAALIAQAAHNGGTWLFDAEESAALASAGGFVAAYLPPPPDHVAPDYADPVTRAVAEQYSDWPFPVWQRAMVDPKARLSARRTRFGLEPLRPGARLLVAGCGTGREAQRLALSAPEAQVIGIDLSAGSLAWASAHCDAPNLTLELRDLHSVAEIGPFDHISCSGVLHHLPDPEAGWAALNAALAPGGTMRIMLYSRIARLQVQAAQRLIPDLLGQPVTAALIRDVRARIIAADFRAAIDSTGFYTMGGVYDLLLHRHEDPFDLPRIGRALDTLGLDLLGFSLPSRKTREAYLAANPDDEAVRDLAALNAWERRHPRLFNAMYDFWCFKRV